MINYTYIAIRMEDLFMVIYLGIYLIQLLRKKTTIDRRFFILFALYWLAVLASSFYAVYIAKTITVKHLAFLHAFRRVEYMSVFLIALSVIKSKKDFIFYIGLILAAFLIVNIYGLGQKFLGWPAVQTMNPEYAKGYLLFLTPEARISSTFSGHYDLAAYLIFLMPIVLGFYFLRSSLKYFLLFIASLLILVFTASRVSYGSYILSTFPFLLFLRKPKHFFVVLLFTLIFTLSSNNLTSRFKRTFQVKQIFVNQQTGQVVIPQAMTSKELPAGSFYIGLKQSGGQQATDSIPKQDELLKERILDEIRTEARSKGKKLSSKEERDLTASIAAKLKPINTVVSDISFATRLQVEWPRAINAFLFNPILGTGPSSITEATDNDYLRSLGEVGLLGTLLLGLIFFIIAKTIIIAFIKMKTDEKYLYGGFLFGLLGLLVNATYIDVFEASKIAFQFWFIAGLFIGFLPYAKAKK
ncbi:MAG: hypothetical protein US11_C0003G0029 [Candidatus Roizmanbacteria bacterium GW2011_GWA2_36_23]|uniref:O-antigen ligase-related domain-containing protein n=1 Tax=Candidatus Roizmanbacteria bacterium GW2011_GWA2_36_23 TaxID=1618480 RepID=A0A0G0HD80_9BACT|nr:MAG: hypothetical protein US11_C0003G0029 [Candidatus Roizmanbacteria bacterium GW2011_GWA2_36_23]